MSEEQMDNAAVMVLLNEILETELAGVVRHAHYPLMVLGIRVSTREGYLINVSC